MNTNGKEIDRRTFIKTSMAAGAGLALMASMGNLVSGAMPGGDVADLSLYQLSKMIQKGDISSKELVELYLERIKKFGGSNGLNAYITVAADEALKQAEELDMLAKQKQFKGPLHGLPIAIKDNLDTRDIRTTGGSKILASWKPPQDAHVITRLKEAGAIILGKTNMHEFAFGITTNNPHYGPTRNPYDFSRIPGGSSGGSGAATASALCAGSIGTDTGGSVRIPASPPSDSADTPDILASRPAGAFQTPRSASVRAMTPAIMPQGAKLSCRNSLSGSAAMTRGK